MSKETKIRTSCGCSFNIAAAIIEQYELTDRKVVVTLCQDCLNKLLQSKYKENWSNSYLYRIITKEKRFNPMSGDALHRILKSIKDRNYKMNDLKIVRDDRKTKKRYYKSELDELIRVKKILEVSE